MSEARKYMGTNPTARKKLWCATFMNFVLAKAGYDGTHSDAAKSFAYYGRRISEPEVGAIAVLTRGKRGGHVGVVSGIDDHGNPIIISGNHNKRVGEAVYPRTRVIAYVMPTGHRPPTTQLAARGSPDNATRGFDSPIAELLAAIEAEQNRGERQARPACRRGRGAASRGAAGAGSRTAGGGSARRSAARPVPRRPVRRQGARAAGAAAGAAATSAARAAGAGPGGRRDRIGQVLRHERSALTRGQSAPYRMIEAPVGELKSRHADTR